MEDIAGYLSLKYAPSWIGTMVQAVLLMLVSSPVRSCLAQQACSGMHYWLALQQGVADYMQLMHTWRTRFQR